jgi:hypothetical protein
MYRKRKNPTPGFRIPPPFAPITAEEQKLRADKPLCRFTLNEELTTSDDSATATITNQYGEGMQHPFTDEIVVLNPETELTGTYAWEGEEDDAGLAVWNTSRQWVIIKMLNVQWKPFVRFTADSAFDENNEWVSGTLETQYGDGVAHTVTTGVFHNLLRHDGDYEFEGDEDDYGLAHFDKYEVDEAGTYGAVDALVAHFCITMFECP